MKRFSVFSAVLLLFAITACGDGGSGGGGEENFIPLVLGEQSTYYGSYELNEICTQSIITGSSCIYPSALRGEFVAVQGIGKYMKYQYRNGSDNNFYYKASTIDTMDFWGGTPQGISRNTVKISYSDGSTMILRKTSDTQTVPDEAPYYANKSAVDLNNNNSITGTYALTGMSVPLDNCTVKSGIFALNNATGKYSYTGVVNCANNTADNISGRDVALDINGKVSFRPDGETILLDNGAGWTYTLKKLYDSVRILQ